jgi:uncharacterized protein with GYD domain
MAKFIVLVNWTADGIKQVKQSAERLDKARALAKAEGVTVETVYLVMGDHDMIAILDAPDDAAMARFALKLGSGGAVSTRTMKAFAEDEYRAIIAAL